MLKLKVDLVGHLAVNSMFTKRSAEYCLADLVDKVGDAKNSSSVQETLSCLAESISLDYIALQVSVAIPQLLTLFYLLAPYSNVLFESGLLNITLFINVYLLMTF